MNKRFDWDDYDECDPVGKAKGVAFLERANIQSFVPEERKDHYDVVMQVESGDITFEMEVRRKHYDNVYNGKYDDVRVPERKLKRGIPDFLGVVSLDENDTRIILVMRDDLKAAIPNRYWAKTFVCPDGEWMIPFPKSVCHRFDMIDGNLVDQGTVP